VNVAIAFNKFDLNRESAKDEEKFVVDFLDALLDKMGTDVANKWQYM
jgi:hypothetical protein